MITFVIGLFVGTWVGVLLCALCVAGRDEKEGWSNKDDEV